MKIFTLILIKLIIICSFLSSCATNSDQFRSKYQFIESYARLRETEERVFAHFPRPESTKNLMKNPRIERNVQDLVWQETTPDILALGSSYASVFKHYRNEKHNPCLEVKKLVQECCLKFGALVHYSKLGWEGESYTFPWNDCFSEIDYYKFIEDNSIDPSSLSSIFEK